MRLWISLHDPLGDELTDPSYSRQPCHFVLHLEADKFNTVKLGITNTSEVMWPPIFYDEKVTVASTGIWSLEKGGTLLLPMVDLSYKRVVRGGDQLLFKDSTVKVELTP
jgi:hypothetical protein